MAVILVVEPDSHHAAQVAAAVRKHLKAQLVVTESAARAVAAMAHCVPDVLLMSPLLSRQDEATLAEWLRDLGPAAAHVQELTIPFLASTPPPVQKPRGVLSGLRRHRTSAGITDGCGLDEFAEQISAYVALARAKRGVPPPAAPVFVQIETVNAIVEEEDTWIPIPLDDLCEEPAPPRQIWALTPIAEELPVAARSEAQPEPIAVATPEPEPEHQSPSGAIAEPGVVVLAAPAPAAQATRRKKGQGRRPGRKPAQDEWGLFDPEQCGFAALVATLNEITDNNNAEQTSADTSVRGITY
jgi:CheY-like chemotaxis protein